PDGTVMTSDCPTGERPRPRRLAVVASSLTAGATLAAPSAMADPPAAGTANTAAPLEATDDPAATGSGSGASAQEPIAIGDKHTGTEVPIVFEMGAMPPVEKRPAVEWSLWGRLGAGFLSQPPDVVARRIGTPSPVEPKSIWEAAALADLTFGLRRD